ncbi:MAG: hypothetical protein EXX96DRAFT_297513 [Benjaminiella poitrasii]|nr:MAG: hypothetical protein EXX96DRAFT_297513 [Benjaminiella poitrasii]
MWDDTESSVTTSRITSSNDDRYETGKRISTHHGSRDSIELQHNRNLIQMLHQIQADLLVKQELVGQLEKTEGQYTQMRTSYEEKLNELNEHLFEIQKQQDNATTAVRKSSSPVKMTRLRRTTASPTTKPRPQSVMQLRENREAQEVRSQFEVKVKRLVAENQELCKKNTIAARAIQTARTKSEEVISRLRADIEALKLDKKQLVKERKQEAERARQTTAKYEREVQQLKRRVLVAFDAKKKLEDESEAQRQLLKKRTDETAAAHMQLRCLTNVLRKAANEGTFLNEVSLDKLLESAQHGVVASTKNQNRRSVILRTGSPAGNNSSVHSK